MFNNPNLSILIATKNRQYTCFELCKSLTFYKNNFEVIVHDNSSSNTLKEKLKSLNDSRIKYFYTNDSISASENFQKALDLSIGNYVIAIGDDDGIHPKIFELVEIAYKKKIDAISYPIELFFTWPNSNVNNSNEGIFTIEKNINKFQSYSIYNPQIELTRFYKNGCVNYLDYHLVKIYHGIVSRNLIMKANNIYGKVFDGLAPDIHSCTLLSSLVDKLLYINFCFSISGVSSTSASADSARGKHVGKLNSAPHFNGFNNYIWNLIIPEFYSVETIWAETSLYALNKINKYSNFYIFNRFKLDFELFKNHFNYSNYIFKAIFYSVNISKNKFTFFINYIINFTYLFFSYLIKAINYKFKRKPIKLIYKLSSINDINSILINHKFSFLDLDEFIYS